MATLSEPEIFVGRDYGAHELTVDPELVQHYAEATGDRNPWYFGPSPFGGPVAPALILHSEVYRYGGWYLKNIFGNLHAKQEWELFHPIMVGDQRDHSLPDLRPLRQAGPRLRGERGDLLRARRPTAHARAHPPELPDGRIGPGDGRGQGAGEEARPHAPRSAAGRSSKSSRRW